MHIVLSQESRSLRQNYCKTENMYSPLFNSEARSNMNRNF